MLRPGAVDIEMIKEATGLIVMSVNGQDRIRVSGSLENHYAPAAKVLLRYTPLPGQGFIALKKVETPEGVIRLASPNNDLDFAHILYSALREADVQGLKEVVVVQPTNSGIGAAIRDRLTRAAGGR